MTVDTGKFGGIKMDNTRPIGFFDSGVGGISVLRKAVRLLPHENFLYYGDSKNAPYGSKDVETIRKLTSDAIDILVQENCKAIVVACNTATSVAIDFLREKYFGIPIIGIEPALKSAVECTDEGKILVLATPRTLTEKKFHALMAGVARTREVIKMPLPGLVEIIEQGVDVEEKADAYLKDALSGLDRNIRAVVLGCTHYPFVKPSIRRILGDDVNIYDGSDGTSRRLHRVLQDRGLLNESTEPGTVTILNSLNSDSIISLSYALLEKDV